MCYLFHHPYVSFMYKSGKHTLPSLSGYSFKEHTEILDPHTYPELNIYTDTDLVRDLSNCHSVSSHVHEDNEISIGWGVYKQPVPINCKNITETTAIFKGVKRVLELRRSLEYMGEENNKPTPVMENNQATITQIKKDRITSRIKKMDIILACLHHLYFMYLLSYNIYLIPYVPFIVPYIKYICISIMVH